MNYAKLRKHLIALASLPKGDAPVISAYFDLSGSRHETRSDFRSWVELTRQTFRNPAVRQDFDDAAEEIEGWLGEAKGSGGAVFCRWGEHPLFLPMTFEVPLETRLHVDDFAVIYPLVELKDRFNRFVVVLTTKESARIIEMNLGAQSVELLTRRPALRERIGREWTREHYKNHTREREKQFVKEKIAIIESLMAKRGHNALILAGDARYVSRMSEALPPHLKSKVIDELKTGVSDERLGEVLSQAVGSFLRAEAEDAHDAVDELVQAVRAGGLATVGTESVALALREGRADRLIVSNTLPQEEQEELVRLASRHTIPIETVQNCELLDRNGGAGCLLRYRSEYLMAEV